MQGADCQKNMEVSIPMGQIKRSTGLAPAMKVISKQCWDQIRLRGNNKYQWNYLHHSFSFLLLIPHSKRKLHEKERVAGKTLP